MDIPYEPNVEPRNEANPGEYVLVENEDGPDVIQVPSADENVRPKTLKRLLIITQHIHNWAVDDHPEIEAVAERVDADEPTWFDTLDAMTAADFEKWFDLSERTARDYLLTFQRMMQMQVFDTQDLIRLRGVGEGFQHLMATLEWGECPVCNAGPIELRHAEKTDFEVHRWTCPDDQSHHGLIEVSG